MAQMPDSILVEVKESSLKLECLKLAIQINQSSPLVDAKEMHEWLQEDSPKESMYTESDLVSFGQFLLSPERKERFAQSDSEMPLEDRLSDVHHADVCNWKNENNKK